MAEKIENIFNECVEAMLHGESLEQCLQRYPQHAAELEPLLRTAMAAHHASAAVEPRPEFKAQMMYRIQSELSATKEKRRAKWLPSFKHMPRWAVAALLIVLVLLMAGGGTVAAASNSAPGDTLYPVKLATENVQLALTFSDTGKANLEAKFASRRIDEMERIIDKGNPDLINATIQRFENHLSKIETLSAKIKLGDVKNIAALKQQVTTHYAKDMAVMQRIEQKVPQRAKQAVERARLRLSAAYEKLLATLDGQ